MADLIFWWWVIAAGAWATFFGASRADAAANPDLYDDDARRWHARMALAAPIWPLVVAWFALGFIAKHFGFIVRDSVINNEGDDR